MLHGRQSSTFVPRLTEAIHHAGGPIDASCHILFHWIGRNYGVQAHLTLARLQYYLPRTNDPTCPAGFAHGLLTALGGQLIVAGPKKVLALCAGSPTRYERYSCVHGLGHAYMRLFSEQLPYALAQCSKLGGQAPDCAQGVFHDYWFSMHGVDNTKKSGVIETPRQVCARQRAAYVLPCWYRVFMEFPPAKAIKHPADLERLCTGLAGLQHDGCITGASAVASPDPFDQIRGCTRLPTRDAEACVRGVGVPEIMTKPLGVQLNLIETCGEFRAARPSCFSWLGRTLNVVTNGRFERVGCPALYPLDRRACLAGARRINDALVTFS
jgi:hypothetical protein